jgi:hypothetical protein
MQVEGDAMSLWFHANGQAGYSFVVQYRHGPSPSGFSWRTAVLITTGVALLTSILWMLWMLRTFLVNRRLRIQQEGARQELALQELPTAVGLGKKLLTSA